MKVIIRLLFALPCGISSLLLARYYGVNDIADWLKSLSPVIGSLAAGRMDLIFGYCPTFFSKPMPEHFDRIAFVFRKPWNMRMRPGSHFPHDYKMKRRMRLTEPATEPAAGCSCQRVAAISTIMQTTSWLL